MAGLDDRGPMVDFIERNDLDGFPHVYDEDGSVWQRFGTITRSAFIYVNDDGSLDKTAYGVYDVDEINRRIDELLTR